MIGREDREGGPTVLRLEHGKANAIDVELADALAAELGRLRAERPAPAVVLTGSGAIFSAGVDLFRVLEEDEGYIDTFLPSLARMLLRLIDHPRPVVAAVNGHAVAGGCILVCACDLRLMAEGEGTIGVPELRVGVPFPGLALDILRAAVPGGRIGELVYGGSTYGPREAAARGLVDEVVPAERLQERALEAAGRLGAIPEPAFALTKRQLRAHLLEADDGTAGQIDAETLAAWKSAEARNAIREHLERTLGRGRR